jgi:hypothetical protein
MRLGIGTVRFSTVSDFEDRKHIVIFVQGAVRGRHPLKLIDLATSLYIQTHRIFDVQLTLKAGAFLENIQVWVASIPRQGPYDILASLPGPEYDKESISHG